MRCVRNILKALSWVFHPMRVNLPFFIFMFLLGYVAGQVEVSGRGGRPYPLTTPELFLDIYAVCLLLSLIPAKVRPWLRAILYVIAYSSTIADVYCFVKFGSTLTPTMLLLVGETNRAEASEFVASYISWDIVGSKLGWILLLVLIHILVATMARFIKLTRIGRRPIIEGILGLLCLVGLVVAIVKTLPNKEAMLRLMTHDTIGDVENELTRKDRARLYTPVYRLAFSLYTNGLASRQVDKLRESIARCQVDSCRFRSPNIVVIIGESFNKYHSQLYGYDHPTTPRQMKMQREGRLVAFTDVVAPWNLTSYVFKNMFSLHAVGDEGEWCDYPLFPVLFRRAGYKVWFMTNQFLPKAKEAVYDFSGGFFLNDPYLSEQQFDVRNKQRYRYDAGLLADFDSTVVREPTSDANLFIFHLKGQHVNYRDKYPSYRKHFRSSDYSWPDLNERERLILADYDNATLYNDSIVSEIVKRFEHEDAIVIYFSDHGEEAFGDGVRLFGRNHSATIDYRLAHEEFDVPFWIWWTESYGEAHPDVVESIRSAAPKPFMTDNLPHLLLHLAGISCQWYEGRYNPLDTIYFEQRQRIIKDTTNYDSLKPYAHP